MTTRHGSIAARNSVVSDRPSSTNPAGSFSRRQQLFIRYTFSVLVDLTVLNLFDEYSDRVVLTSFSASLLAAALLQVLLKVTLALERRITAHFSAKPGLGAKEVQRLLSIGALLFGSKLVILGLINVSFGDRVLFLGRAHGAFTFVVVVLAMLVAERTIQRIYLALA
jgi:hypothetical protein